MKEISIPTLRRLASGPDPNSFSNRMRSARFRRFENLISSLTRPMRILDIGGTNEFWENRGWAGRSDVQIYSLNLVAEERKHANIHPIAGDATSLREFGDRSFDVAFSNSVIEHLFTYENQRKMASEIQRVGKAYWVQTPNFWFPIEPHFHVPAWQWLPIEVRIAIIRRWRCGWRGPCPDAMAARNAVQEIRLLSRRDLQEIFPNATLLQERLGPFIKSWIAVEGFPLLSNKFCPAETEQSIATATSR